MIISKNVRVTGVVTFKRLFRIDGNVDATFSAPPEASLIVGAHGTVTGDISGMNTVLIEGTVNGDIGVKTVSLKSSAVINGDIRCRYIEIEPKAVVKGNVYVMSDEEYLQTLPVVEPEMPPPPVKTIMLIVDPQVDHLSTGARPVAGAEDDAKRVADYITQKAHDIDEIFITLESRHVSLQHQSVLPIPAVLVF
jgi:cytoskeletal protein CcmA (bactofilin family)